MKRITILGSTGSIGTSSLKVIESNPEEYRVVALAAGSNIRLLSEQIKKYRPDVVAVLEKDAADVLKNLFSGTSGPKILYGTEGFSHVASCESVDIVISAIAGAAGLIPTYEAIRAGKDVALANKETIVMAGPIIMDLANKMGTTILPIDSEHSAILQSRQGHLKEDLKRIILTASGGPFRDMPLADMENITPAMALKHPNWDMGRKISIDSATLMNKGLETIEAKWLFDLKMEQISILIHPESIIHSMVEYIDGSIIAQMGIPDMKTPISYALSYPRHLKTSLPSLNLEDIGTLSFYQVDLEKFRCLSLALKAAEIGKSMPTVLNAANEIAVESFLQGKIKFLEVPVLIEKIMEKHEIFPIKTINEVIKADRWARKNAEKEILKMSK
ncbi:MAG: 1-deoxy-D-xylulose-5-phosphate reductoisomerase [Deltaproteobacteria bacterium]|nr:1-deoxy-D-xylulose-5-phosphate reductoisomerase [Deltaproteobacteria bacterium]